MTVPIIPLYLKKEVFKKAVDLEKGKCGIIPTDTVYGIVASAFKKEAIKKVYKLKLRDTSKASIILISNINDLKKFNINVSDSETIRFLKKIWPGKVSVVFDFRDKQFAYLSAGNNSLAFRMPASEWLVNFLKVSGPLIAPSANPQGEKPAFTVEEALNYFGNKVDFYIDGGKSSVLEPSTLIYLDSKGKKIKLLRKGCVSFQKIKNIFKKCFFS